MSQLEKLKKRLFDLDICSEEELQGCSAKQIRQIEKSVGYRLPKTYKEIMAVIGIGAGKLGDDLEMFFPEVLTLTSKAKSWSSDYEELVLGDKVFVFVSRDNEQILFFELEESDDPPIFRWCADTPSEMNQVFDSIWEFIEEEIRIFAK